MTSSSLTKDNFPWRIFLWQDYSRPKCLTCRISSPPQTTPSRSRSRFPSYTRMKFGIWWQTEQHEGNVLIVWRKSRTTFTTSLWVGRAINLACENLLLDASLYWVNTRLVTISGNAFSHSGWWVTRDPENEFFFVLRFFVDCSFLLVSRYVWRALMRCTHLHIKPWFSQDRSNVIHTLQFLHTYSSIHNSWFLEHVAGGGIFPVGSGAVGWLLTVGFYSGWRRWRSVRVAGRKQHKRCCTQLRMKDVDEETLQIYEIQPWDPVPQTWAAWTAVVTWREISAWIPLSCWIWR